MLNKIGRNPTKNFVVIAEKDQRLSVIPTCWIVDEKLNRFYHPKKKSEAEITKLIEEKAVPKSDKNIKWRMYNIEILHYESGK